ncbi:hypothetical protein EVAR_54789_1 [Eumeta japonica]|uniref:Uncharacterized protein n=1 Tax=Eumeta variegata TaxID=151549 RepID=A0A4C1Y1I1_EUMVA|nr:hypothetical protein EVAR_54789_1 [Eumeta japonica]
MPIAAQLEGRQHRCIKKRRRIVTSIFTAKNGSKSQSKCSGSGAGAGGGVVDRRDVTAPPPRRLRRSKTPRRTSCMRNDACPKVLRLSCAGRRRANSRFVTIAAGARENVNEPTSARPQGAARALGIATVKLVRRLGTTRPPPCTGMRERAAARR